MADEALQRAECTEGSRYAVLVDIADQAAGRTVDEQLAVHAGDSLVPSRGKDARRDGRALLVRRSWLAQRVRIRERDDPVAPRDRHEHCQITLRGVDDVGERVRAPETPV